MIYVRGQNGRTGEKCTAMSNEFDLYRLPWDLSLSIEEKVAASQRPGKRKDISESELLLWSLKMSLKLNNNKAYEERYAYL